MNGKLRALALDSKAWKINGCIVTDEYDTYPPDLFYAAANEDVVLALLDENKALRSELLKPKDDYTHQCRSCGHLYQPYEGKSEDCPKCGSDGTTRAELTKGQTP